MSVIEKNISQFIQNQFPDVYREEGENFVEFVKQYYMWMEEPDNALYHSRRQMEYKDIDETVDEFLVMFKQKYLSDIQLDTASQTRKLIKHSLDLYRAKGTERAVDVFFRSIFGVDAEVYYPGDDIFRLSDGRWVKPTYLEVSSSTYNKEFVGKQIQGVASGATAFVERYIRRKIKSKYIDILYISAINGDFQTNELITLPGQNLRGIPKVIGSLTSMQIIAGGANFAVGEIVTLNTDNGVQGKGRVSVVSNLTGTVDFKIDDFGWGYTANSEVLISEKVLYLQNVRTVSTGRGLHFDIFETIKQPAANISIINANNDVSGLSNGTMLYTYYSNNVVAGIGKVMAYTANGATNGEIYVAEIKNTLGTVIEPSANLTGSVSVTEVSTPIAGYSSTTVNSNVVTGTGTFFSADLKVGAIVKTYVFDSSNGVFIGSELKKISSIANNISLTFTTNASFTSTNVSIVLQGGKIVTGTSTAFNTDFVYGDIVAIHSNSTNYYLHSVNAVTNSTYMTLQDDVVFTNAAANFAKVTYSNTIYVSTNTSSANINTRTDKSTTANVIGVSSNIVIYTANQNLGVFANTEYVYQLNAGGDEIARAKVRAVQSTIGANSLYSLSDSTGVFIPDSVYPIRTRYANGLPTGKTANLISVDLTVGVVSVNTAFVNTAYNYIAGTNSLSNATLTRVSSGVLADFGISNNMQYPETVYIGSEPVSDYLYVNINALRYGFKHYPAANGGTEYIEDCFDNQAYTFGGISALVSVNPGKNYDVAPFVLIYEPLTAQNQYYDYVFEIIDPSAIFKEGEIIEQDITGGTTSGLVKSANLTHVFVRRIQYANQFELNKLITGKSSKASANVISISTDTLSLPIGLDAIVLSNVQSSNGSVTKLDVYDSGFGYINDEDTTFTSADGTRAGLARISLGKQGQSEGYYSNRKGQLSDSKYIFDGEYYQEYSYEIRSSISPDKYKEMLKKVIHVAGTKSFAATVVMRVANSSPNVIAEIEKTEL
jgi:hypothetical protein